MHRASSDIIVSVAAYTPAPQLCCDCEKIAAALINLQEAKGSISLLPEAHLACLLYQLAHPQFSQLHH